jgi:trehalose-6-phosphate synthase
MGLLIIVSNRSPFNFSEELINGIQTSVKYGKKPKAPVFGEGGLVQAMSGLLKPGEWDTTWLGASMGERDIDVSRGHYSTLFRKMKNKGLAPQFFPFIRIGPDRRMRFQFKEYDFYIRFVFFDRSHMHSYYSKFANGFLWPLVHLTRSPLFYKNTKTFPRPVFEKYDFVQYISSGVTFANTVIDEISKSEELLEKEGDIVVWNQDYHLMRISEVLKAQLREKKISEHMKERIHVGQFMHTPFFNIHDIQGLIREDKRRRVKYKIDDPFSESIETALQKITWGMLSNDFIGFHTKEYCDNYLEALEEWFPVEIRVSSGSYEIIFQDHVTTIAPFPIGLDVDRILSEVSRGKRLNYRLGKESLYKKIERDKRNGLYIFGGLERCDYTKGLPERLQVFFHAKNRLKSTEMDARLYQVSSPSRLDSLDYRKLQGILEKEVNELNKKLGEDSILHIDEGIPSPQNYRFMKEIDVMLVTPLEDGMNLVAMEYILSQKFKASRKRGILALSNSGASRVLKVAGFSEEDGIVYINPMRPKVAGEIIVSALVRGLGISDNLINYIQKEHRIDEWAKKNMDAIMNSRKSL